MRQHLFDTAIRLFRSQGYEATTLRGLAKEAGVSPALLYRYFSSKRAVVLALYGQLTETFVTEARTMKRGTWRTRAMAALRTSLEVLGEERELLKTLLPVLVADPEEGVLGGSTRSSREQVEAIFIEAVVGATDAPAGEAAAALGRVLYLAHLVVILGWLLDRSADQRATHALLATLEKSLTLAAIALRAQPGRAFLRRLDATLREGLGEGASP